MLRRLLVVALLPSAIAAQEPFDRSMIAKIRDEGLNHSQAWAMLDTLATVIGPRLAGSPAF
ncbi:MAG: peptidase M28, partial [Gemmatimonas sp.]